MFLNIKAGQTKRKYDIILLSVRKKFTIRAYIIVSVVIFPKKLGIGPDKLFTETDL